MTPREQQVSKFRRIEIVLAGNSDYGEEGIAPGIGEGDGGFRSVGTEVSLPSDRQVGPAVSIN